MIKNTNYFPHDFNARHDKKMVKLRLSMGMTGVGIYWSIVEMLYEQGGEIFLTDIDFIAKEWREKRKKIEEVLQNFELFQNNSEVFWSESVNKRLNKITAKSLKATESAGKRWGNDANALQTDSERNASKVKYSKVKENIIKDDSFLNENGDEPKMILVSEYDFKTCQLKADHPHRQLIESGLRLFSFFRQKTQNKDLEIYSLREWLEPIKILHKNYNREQIEELVEYANADKFWGAIVLNTDSLQRNFEKIKAQFIKSLNEK